MNNNFEAAASQNSSLAKYDQTIKDIKAIISDALGFEFALLESAKPGIWGVEFKTFQSPFNEFLLHESPCVGIYVQTKGLRRHLFEEAVARPTCAVRMVKNEPVLILNATDMQGMAPADPKTIRNAIISRVVTAGINIETLIRQSATTTTQSSTIDETRRPTSSSINL